jgi:hypothetical protein
VRSDGEPNTENDVNTKVLAENDDAEQSQAGTKAAIDEEKEEPNEAERRQIEDDEGAGKLSQTDGTEAAIDEEEEEPNEGERKKLRTMKEQESGVRPKKAEERPRMTAG